MLSRGLAAVLATSFGCLGWAQSGAFHTADGRVVKGAVVAIGDGTIRVHTESGGEEIAIEDLHRFVPGDAGLLGGTASLRNGSIRVIEDGKTAEKNRGAVKLQPGYHRFKLFYWQGGEDPYLNFKFAAAGGEPDELPKEMIYRWKDQGSETGSEGFDQEGFRLPETEEDDRVAPGGNHRIHRYQAEALPESWRDLEKAPVHTNATSSTFYDVVVKGGEKQNFGVVFEGLLKIEAAGEYEFVLRSNGRSEFYLGDPAQAPIRRTPLAAPKEAGAPEEEPQPDQGPPSVAFDDFEDKNVANNRANDIAWVVAQNCYSPRVLNNRSSVGPPEGNMLYMRANGTYPTMAGVFSEAKGAPDGGGEGVRLGGDVGDKLELSLEFRWLGTPGDDAQIRLGLLNNAGTPEKTSGGKGFADDRGYFTRLSFSGGKAYLAKEIGGHGSLCGGSDFFSLSSQVSVAFKPLQTRGHKIGFTLARMPGGGVEVTVALDGKTIASAADSPQSQGPKDPPGVTTVFHELGISSGPDSSGGLFLDNVRIRQILKSGATPSGAPGAAPPPEAKWHFRFHGAGRLDGTLPEWSAGLVRILPDDFPEHRPISVPAAHLKSVCRTSEKDLQARLEAAADTGQDVAYVKVSKDRIQEVQGTVKGIDGESLLFEFRGETRRIAMETVAGLRLTLTREAKDFGREFHQAVQLEAGPEFPGFWEAADDEQLNWRTPAGEVLRFPWDDVRLVRSVNGRLQYLSEMQPVAVEQTPFLDRVIPWSADRSLLGKGIILSKIQDKPYQRGVCLHSRTLLTYSLAGNFERFQGLVGFLYPEGRAGVVDLRVLADDRVLLEKNAFRSGATELLDLDVSGAEELVLEVDFGGEQDVGDHVAFADARLIRARR